MDDQYVVLAVKLLDQLHLTVKDFITVQVRHVETQELIPTLKGAETRVFNVSVTFRFKPIEIVSKTAFNELLDGPIFNRLYFSILEIFAKDKDRGYLGIRGRCGAKQTLFDHQSLKTVHNLQLFETAVHEFSSIDEALTNDDFSECAAFYFSKENNAQQA